MPTTSSVVKVLVPPIIVPNSIPWRRVKSPGMRRRRTYPTATVEMAK